MDYSRIALTAFAFCILPESQTGTFVALYLLNFALDGLDGMLARRLRQVGTVNGRVPELRWRLQADTRGSRQFLPAGVFIISSAATCACTIPYVLTELDAGGIPGRVH